MTRAGFSVLLGLTMTLLSGPGSITSWFDAGHPALASHGIRPIVLSSGAATATATELVCAGPSETVFPGSSRIMVRATLREVNGPSLSGREIRWSREGRGPVAVAPSSSLTDSGGTASTGLLVPFDLGGDGTAIITAAFASDDIYGAASCQAEVRWLSPGLPTPPPPSGSVTATPTPRVTPTPTATAIPLDPIHFPPVWQDQPPRGPRLTSVCPQPGQWLLLYWGSGSLQIASIAGACPSADRYWTNREGRWLGFSPDAAGASDTWTVSYGEAHFIHGRP